MCKIFIISPFVPQIANEKTRRAIEKTSLFKIMRKYFWLFLLLIFCCPDSFAQNLRAEGYKGIWFTLGQFSDYGDKYSGGLGTYTADHIPIAIYSPSVE
jgi:hypothetical protein